MEVPRWPSQNADYTEGQDLAINQIKESKPSLKGRGGGGTSLAQPGDWEADEASHFIWVCVSLVTLSFLENNYVGEFH